MQDILLCKIQAVKRLSAGMSEDSREAIEITQWLAQRGCDLKASAANGDTLLHIAADAGDAPFVRYLLQRGLDASAPGEYRLPPLGSTHNEDVALLLLEAGSDPSKMDDSPHEFLRYAEGNHWKRVVEWLRVRGK
jgi:ankyrin repeat protein